jgi:hypothetical protein
MIARQNWSSSASIFARAGSEPLQEASTQAHTPSTTALMIAFFT